MRGPQIGLHEKKALDRAYRQAKGAYELGMTEKDAPQAAGL